VNFEGIVKSIEGETDKLLWMRYLKSENPQKEVLPKPYADTLNSFQKGMLVKILSNMKMMGGIKEFVRDNLGEHYIVSPPFDLEGSLNDSSNVTPIIFVLSPGADPIAYLIALAEAKGMSDKFRQISLGQGQNFIAEKLIKEGQEHGMWICL
jgi:dynein heavy chain